MKQFHIYFYVMCSLLIKGLISGLMWPEAIVCVFLACLCIADKEMTVKKEMKEKEIEAELKVKELESATKDDDLKQKVQSLENKMALAGIVRRK